MRTSLIRRAIQRGCREESDHGQNRSSSNLCNTYSNSSSGALHQDVIQSCKGLNSEWTYLGNDRIPLGHSSTRSYLPIPGDPWQMQLVSGGSFRHPRELPASFFPPSLLFPVIPLLHKDLSTLSRLSLVSHPAQIRDTSDSPQVCPKSPHIQPRHHQVYA